MISYQSYLLSCIFPYPNLTYLVLVLVFCVSLSLSLSRVVHTQVDTFVSLYLNSRHPKQHTQLHFPQRLATTGLLTYTNTPDVPTALTSTSKMPVATPHPTLDHQHDQSQPTNANSNGVNGNGVVNGTKNGVTSGSSIIQEILARRAKAGKLVAGVAAASDSDMWKGPVSHAIQRHGLVMQTAYANDTNMHASKPENQRQSVGTVSCMHILIPHIPLKSVETNKSPNRPFEQGEFGTQAMHAEASSQASEETGTHFPWRRLALQRDVSIC